MNSNHKFQPPIPPAHAEERLIEMAESRTQAGNSLEPWFELNDKVVMVTGASSGLGRGFCLDLAKAGCRIIAAARRIDRLQSLCEEINNSAGSGSSSVLNQIQPRAVAVELDVTASDSINEDSVGKAWDAFGRIDALINNAGVRGSEHTPLDLTEDEWNDIIRTNLTGTWLVSKHVCRLMRDAKRGGSVINISSIAGLDRGQLPGSLVYAASKAAVNTMTKVMAMELGVYKIRVNSIAPGLFQSEITQGLMQKDWLKIVAAKTVPLRTYGESDPALTSLARYLIHDSSEYVSGNVFIVEAGATLPGQKRPSLEIAEEEWNRVLKTNLIGTWQVSKCVASRLRSANRRGSIINISSITGLNRVQFFGGIAYNSSKSAVDSITRIMALELGGYNIRVNSIAPGLFPSEISGAIFQHNLEILAKKMIPLRTSGPTNPALTSLVRYLVHDSSNYVSGNTFIVDFGSSLPGVPIYSSL